MADLKKGDEVKIINSKGYNNRVRHKRALVTNISPWLVDNISKRKFSYVEVSCCGERFIFYDSDLEKVSTQTEFEF